MTSSRRRILSLPLAVLAHQWGCTSRASRVSAQEPDASPTYGLRIPDSHPRLWWTPERLAVARAQFSPGRFRERRDDYLGYAYRYLMTGNTRDARTAIDWAMSVTFSTAVVGSNEARWFGEVAILIYDWLYDQFGPAERDIFVERWNGYLHALQGKDWGGPGMPQSNYFWGYLRNDIEWAITTWHENPKAPAFLDHAMRVRWQDSFLPNANGPARGGVPLEGSQYGRYLLHYASVPLLTAHLHGRPMLAETSFFTEVMFWLIYATTPAPTTPQSGGSPRWEVFPMGDDQFFQHGGSAESVEYGTYVATMAGVWGDLPVGEYARSWLKRTAAVRPHFVAAVEQQGLERDFSSLPLDYYAPGPQHLYVRTSWERDATVIHLQLGGVSGGAHEHADHGTWQIWRNGRWLSRETTGYSHRLAGYRGQGMIEAAHTAAHNGILLNGRGLADGVRNGQPSVKRLERNDSYVYASVDLTPSYRNDQVPGRRAERDNAVAARVEREFVFLRPLETLVIFDRVHSNGNSMPAEQVTRTFLAHFEENPSLEGSNAVLATNGDQALRLITLVPAAPDRQVIPEGPPVGQYRLEVETQGSKSGFFLNVLQARDLSALDVAADVVETPEHYSLTIQHPEKGNARIVFHKESSAATALQFSLTEVPAEVSPLLSRVQEIRVTSDGPEWEKLPGIDGDVVVEGERIPRAQSRRR